MKPTPVHRLACWSLFCAALWGCQGPAAPKLVPIQGQVKYKQRPLGGATICFVPDFAKGNHKELEATGQTAQDGSFTLQTYPHGDGAMAGFYKVICIVMGGPSPPQKYRNSTLTPLAVEVKEQGNEPFVFNLTD